MEGFIRLGDLSSAATRSIELHRLTDSEVQVYRCFMAKLGRARVPKIVELSKVGFQIGINYNAARKAKNALVKKGFLEQWTTTFKDEHGLFRRATYYRLKV